MIQYGVRCELAEGCALHTRLRREGSAVALAAAEVAVAAGLWSEEVRVALDCSAVVEAGRGFELLSWLGPSASRKFAASAAPAMTGGIVLGEGRVALESWG